MKTKTLQKRIFYALPEEMHDDLKLYFDLADAWEEKACRDALHWAAKWIEAQALADGQPVVKAFAAEMAAAVRRLSSNCGAWRNPQRVG